MAEYNKSYTLRTALIVALGGFLMGFDASVISGVVKFIEPEFNLTKIELGWAVSCLTLTSTFAMMTAGPLSDRFGRKAILKWAALLYAISAVFSALAPSFTILVIARMIGGLGVGASLILAPVYIAEISPAKVRGQMVSFNQLNIVIGISVAFFTNYFILQLGDSQAAWAQNLMFDEYNWRWMLGLETLPALIFMSSLFFVPESPRWLAMNDREEEALTILSRITNEVQAQKDIDAVHKSIQRESAQEKVRIAELFKPAMRLVLIIGVVIGILQQITGINSVFFYAPLIFEQSGIGTNASFMQAILVGVINVVSTVIAILLIDKLGRKRLLLVGVAGIALCMFLLAYGFDAASYTLTEESVASLPAEVQKADLNVMINTTYESDVAFKNRLIELLGSEQAKAYESDIISAAITMNPMLILIGILGFVASFGISLGPVMWVLFSELFPNWIRGLAISFVGFINSAVSFLVQLLFPWELANIGNSGTFLIYGLFAVAGLLFVMYKVPETKGKSLEELEQILVK